MSRGWSTAGDVQKVSLQELKTQFGDASGTWLYHIVRGVDTSAVVSRTRAKVGP
jgi:DNA polymerase eta